MNIIDTKRELSEKAFIKAYENGIEGLHAESPGFSYTCPDCLDSYDICCEYKARELWENGDIYEEPSFSWQACGICSSHLGGNRHSAHALDENNDIIHLEVCVDCVGR